jgi:hypothetical protein
VVTPQRFVIGTENETTLAMGASVPTTKDDPVVAGSGWIVVVDPLLQPATSSAVAASEINAMGKHLPCVLESISDASHSQLVRVLEGSM